MENERLEHIEEKLDTIAKAETPWNKYAIQLITLVFLAGGGWVTLSNIEALAQDNREKIEAQEELDHKLERKLERIEERQENFREDINELKEDNDQLDNKLDQILEELRNN